MRAAMAARAARAARAVRRTEDMQRLGTTRTSLLTRMAMGKGTTGISAMREWWDK